MKIVLASHNEHKVEEVSAILNDLDIEIVSLTKIGIHDEIVEDGTSMEENAWIKARYIYNLIGGNVIADDSGIEVDALEGAPGIYSARYAGPQRSSEDNMQKLLKALQKKDDRSAQFRTVMAVILNGKEYTLEGKVRGTIAHECSGEGGFGYDPIFIPEGYDQSFAILSAQIKNQISHRGNALEAFRKLIEAEIQ